MNPARLVADDLDGDGRPDLATVDFDSSTVSVLFGRGTGGFRKRIRYRAARHPVGITAADVSGNGNLDLVTASSNRAGTVSVFLNLGARRFVRASTYRSGAKAYAVAAADIHGDGFVDLLTAHYQRRHLVVLRGLGGGRFAVERRYRGPGASDIAVADINRDGTLDVALAAGASDSLVIRLGLRDRSFAAAQRYRSGLDPFGVTLADFNHDGKPDIAVANYGAGSVSVFLGAGDGTFAPRRRYSMGFDSDAVIASDFDGDGNVDIASPDLFGPHVRRGRGDGTFGDPQRVGFAPTQGGAVADFNGDGRADLAFAGRCDFDCAGSWVDVFLNWTWLPAPPCVVPDISSRIFEERLGHTTRVLRRSGCRLGRVRHRYSRRARRGVVISQRPSHDSVLPSHGEVDVVVRRGRRR